MSPRLFVLASALLLSAGALLAEDAALAKPSSVPPYELKNRSSLPNIDDTTRPPFWPIGWVKRTNAPVGQVQVTAAPTVIVDESNVVSVLKEPAKLYPQPSKSY